VNISGKFGALNYMFYYLMKVVFSLNKRMKGGAALLFIKDGLMVQDYLNSEIYFN
jgi:hypothetical protein